MSRKSTRMFHLLMKGGGLIKEAVLKTQTVLKGEIAQQCDTK